jgi:ATP-dependent Lhr-like helicase
VCEGERGAETLTFWRREALASLPPPLLEGVTLSPTASSILDLLRNRGALFLAEIAGQLRVSPGATRTALWSLLRLGLVTNDQLDLLRRGEPPREEEALVMRSRGEVRAFLRDARRRHETAWPEGRWSLIAWGAPDPEHAAFFQARLLLERYGIVSRELAVQSGSPTPWRILYEILSRMELAGEVRRGYFVEGLSGAQFALPEAGQLLQEIGLPSSVQAPVLLLHSLDPANLYGSGSAFELSAPFLRRHGNWLELKAGRPLLLIEQQGKRLTATPSATTDELAQAVARLSEVLKQTPGRDVRHKLTVETWNEQPVTSTIGMELLQQAGFVRDYQAMTLYAVWNNA